MKQSHDYKITTDPEYFIEQDDISPELAAKMDYYESLVNRGRRSGISKLQDAIEKYPGNLSLKNLLINLYDSLGETEKVLEMHRQIVEENPDYLFGRLNLAFEYFFLQEFNKIPAVLGESMELKALYPHREIFHLLEVTAFYRTAVMYFSAVDKFEEAESRFRIIEELDPDSEDAEIARNFLMKTGRGRGEEEEEKIHVKVKAGNQPATALQTPPVFIHPEIEILYKKGLFIEKELLDTILSLPRESLIEDLERILDDSIRRYSYFSDKIENGESDEETSSFVVHALYLLGELEAEESLETVFKVLSQSDDYLEMFLGDFVTTSLWEPVYKIANKQLDRCFEFMTQPGVVCYARDVIPAIVEQIYLHQPDRKTEVIDWFSKVFSFFLSCKQDENVLDSELIALMVCDIVDIQAKQLLPIIKQIYDEGLVSEWISGTYESVAEDIEIIPSFSPRRDILTVSDRYKEVTETWAGYNYNFSGNDFDFDSTGNNMSRSEPVVKGPKIGRNDPCPCGSGKKYKKCCMSKDDRS
ncbi:MAG TPA: DUF1186 domain-containing protein [Bacteroidales bacterium]|nr:DUF1186 domain-containing protein [Bacteroidales bacterium]